MNDLIVDYRDPLFSIIILFSLIFIISFLTYSFGLYKEKKSRQEYKKLLKRFELGQLQEDDYIHLYKTYNLPFDSIVLLASSFLHKGDYTKAISVYLTLLDHVNDPVKKEELLELLGVTYFKGGFLQRSRDIFLTILEFSPRNKKALHYLLMSYEQLKDFDQASTVIQSLEELESNVQIETSYLEAMHIIHAPLSPFDKKFELLFECFKRNPIIERIFIEYALQFNKPFLWKNLDLFNIPSHIDLFWYLEFEDISFEVIQNHTFLSELYTAKGYTNKATKSNSFELDVLIVLNQHKRNTASLNFEFICQKCKHVLPIYSHRCPQCHAILPLHVQPHLTRSSIEKNQSLQ